MRSTKVVKHNEQIKMYLDPGLVAKGLSVEDLLRELQLEVRALGVSAGTLLLQKFIEAEATQLTGERYTRSSEYYPWGKQNGYVMVGGQKVRLERPRIRRGRGTGEEVALETYQRFQQEDDRTRRVFATLLANVSCRHYGKAIETVQAGYGISKSVVSREMVEATTHQLHELCNRRLETVDVAVLVIDGIEVDETVFVAALGVDRQGVKHLLGFREGATENAEVCVQLMNDLKERGLAMDHAVLAVLDGSKALHKAVTRFFGSHVLIQRCREHKIRNVKSHLPAKYHVDIERKLRAAYAMKDYAPATEALRAVQRELERMNESAARSLEEGLEETLTVQRLGLPETLRQSFATTNMIESTFSRSRSVMQNVKRWKNTAHKARWVATALLEAERSFRRIKGHRSMSVLVGAVEALVSPLVENRQAA